MDVDNSAGFVPINLAGMDTKTTYLLCPDPSCDSFFADNFMCEDNCPKVKELVKMIKCIGCGGLVELPGNHSSWHRVDHHCANGDVCGNFQRMTGKHQLTYVRPII